MLGIPNERFFPALGTGPITAEFMAALQRRHRVTRVAMNEMLPVVGLLASPGGGDKGAFGAGLLNG